MNSLLPEYLARITNLGSRQDLISLYRWLWDQSARVDEATSSLNRSLGLSGEGTFRPHLPTVGIGGFRGLVVLGVNPGWRADLNAREDAYCRSSKEAYVDLKLNFFDVHPRVVGRRIQWWAQALSLVELLRDWRQQFGVYSGGAKWERAHSSQLVGGWDLIPFHSTSDMVTHLIQADQWFRSCALESVAALERMRPELLVIASKAGAQLVRALLHPELAWSEVTIGSGPLSTSVARAVTGEGVELIAIERQIGAHRNYTNKDLFAGVDRMRLTTR